MSDLNVKKIQPTKGYVLVEPSKAQAKTSSGIILPDNDSEKPQHGVVLAVGEVDDCCDDRCGDGCCGDGCGDCDDHHGHSHEHEHDHDEACQSAPVKVGDKVIYKKWGGNDFKIGDTEYQFLKFEDILAVISK